MKLMMAVVYMRDIRDTNNEPDCQPVKTQDKKILTLCHR